MSRPWAWVWQELPGYLGPELSPLVDAVGWSGGEQRLAAAAAESQSVIKQNTIHKVVELNWIAIGFCSNTYPRYDGVWGIAEPTC